MYVADATNGSVYEVVSKLVSYVRYFFPIHGALHALHVDECCFNTKLLQTLQQILPSLRVEYFALAVFEILLPASLLSKYC